jgi:hypothetical protein
MYHFGALYHMHLYYFPLKDLYSLGLELYAFLVLGKVCMLWMSVWCMK